MEIKTQVTRGKTFTELSYFLPPRERLRPYDSIKAGSFIGWQPVSWFCFLWKVRDPFIIIIYLHVLHFFGN